MEESSGGAAKVPVDQLASVWLHVLDNFIAMIDKVQNATQLASFDAAENCMYHSFSCNSRHYNEKGPSVNCTFSLG